MAGVEIMCTVSLISVDDTLRLICNRDELRSRPPALPPTVISHRGVRAIMPVDPESGGTWVAATEAGLAFALLNVNAQAEATGTCSPEGDHPAARSRGEIVPQLLACRSVEEVVSAATAIDRSAYRPFRLIVASRGLAINVAPGNQAVGRWPLTSPLMFTSSGLGDTLVEAPRQALFQRMVRHGADLAERQNRFHLHRWRARPHLSVLMSRADACTVSRTIVEVGPGHVLLTYFARPSEISSGTTLTLWK